MMRDEWFTDEEAAEITRRINARGNMTEAEWMASDDPVAMLNHLLRFPTGDESGGRECHSHCPSEGKFKLFVKACRSLGRHGGMELDIDQPNELKRAVLHWCQGGINPELDRELPLSARASLLREIVGNPFNPCHWSPSLLTDAGREAVRLARSAYDSPGADGSLDAGRLMVLSDALEESGCENERILRHLRRPPLCVWCKGSRFVEQPLKKGGPYERDDRMYIVPPPTTRNVQCFACAEEECGPHVRGCWAVDAILGLN